MRHLSLLTATALVLLLVLSHTYTTPTLAQDGTPTATQSTNPDCKPASVITTANALKSTGDTKQDLSALQKLSVEITTQDIACNGLKFTGSGAKIVGPFSLSKGFYIVTAVTTAAINDSLNIETKTVGTCSGLPPIMPFDKNAMVNPANKYTSLLWMEEDCRIAFQLSQVSSAWVITIEPLSAFSKTTDPSVSCALASIIKQAEALTTETVDMVALLNLKDAIQTQTIACNGLNFRGVTGDVLPPFNLAAGTYKVTVKTLGFFIIQGYALDDKCNMAFPFIDPGINKDDTTTSAEGLFTLDHTCRVTFFLQNVTRDWTLTFEPLQ